MTLEEVRWKQRFENFETAFEALKEFSRNEANVPDKYSDLAVTTIFTLVFELGWKTMQDYMKTKGVVEKFPRDVIKAAYNNKLIPSAQAWIDMIYDRNMLSHNYDQEEAGKVLENIETIYLNVFKDFYEIMSKKYSNND